MIETEKLDQILQNQEQIFHNEELLLRGMLMCLPDDIEDDHTLIQETNLAIAVLQMSAQNNKRNDRFVFHCAKCHTEIAVKTESGGELPQCEMCGNIHWPVCENLKDCCRVHLKRIQIDWGRE